MPAPISVSEIKRGAELLLHVGPYQLEREPRPCLQSGPTFRHKVVPLPVLVEPKLWHIAVLVDAKGQVVGESLGMWSLRWPSW